MTQVEALERANHALAEAGEAPETFTLLGIEYYTVARQAERFRQMHEQSKSWALETLGEGAVGLDLEVTNRLINKCIPHWQVVFFKKATNHKYRHHVITVEIAEDHTTRIQKSL